jgi:hypothetical protein
MKSQDLPPLSNISAAGIQLCAVQPRATLHVDGVFPTAPKSHATQKVLPNIIDPVNCNLPSTVNAVVEMKIRTKTLLLLFKDFATVAGFSLRGVNPTLALEIRSLQDEVS